MLMRAGSRLGSPFFTPFPFSAQLPSFSFSSSSSSSSSLAEFFQLRAEAGEHKDVLRVCHQFYDQEGLRWTWNELKNWSDSWARGILTIRLKRGERFCVSLGNDTEAIITDLASPRVGVIVGSLPPDAPASSFECCFDNLKPRSVLIHDQFNGEWRTKLIRSLIPEMEDLDEGDLLLPRRFSSIRNVIHTGPDRSQAIAQIRDLFVRNPLIDPLRKVRVSGDDGVFSIPSDGKWRGFRQSAVVATAEALAKELGFTRDDRINMNLPLHSINGKFAGLFSVLANLSVLVIPSQSFHPTTTLQTLQDEVCTCLLVTSDQLQSLLNAENLSSINLERLEKLVVVDSGCAPTSNLLSEAKSKLKVKDIRVCIGGVATAPFLVSGSGDPLNFISLSTAQVNVVDEKQALVAPNVSGKLVLKGPSAPSSVWLNGIAQAESEWITTELQGKKTPEGFALS